MSVTCDLDRFPAFDYESAEIRDLSRGQTVIHDGDTKTILGLQKYDKEGVALGVRYWDSRLPNGGRAYCYASTWRMWRDGKTVRSF